MIRSATEFSEMPPLGPKERIMPNPDICRQTHLPNRSVDHFASINAFVDSEGDGMKFLRKIPFPNRKSIAIVRSASRDIYRVRKILGSQFLKVRGWNKLQKVARQSDQRFFQISPSQKNKNDWRRANGAARTF
jgi:hypothetical protein